MSDGGLGIPVNASKGIMQSTPASKLSQRPVGQVPPHVASSAGTQQQRLLLQQKLRQQQQQQQQAMQNYENQFYQFLMTINKKPKRLYNFAEDTDAILKKYEQFRPSFEFHIYENNYKICAPANTRLQQQQRTPQATSDGLILNKNNETLKEFLEYVARGRIPESIMEVLRDCNIQFYEGNLILQVYDHTNTVDIKQPQNKSSEQAAGAQIQNSNDTQVSSSSAANTSANKGLDSSSQSSEPTKDGKEHVATFKRPRVYRTLLRPNDLTHYYDMLSYADHTRFSDNIYQQLEAEILTLTKRNLCLDVHLNPYEHQDKLDESLFLKPTYDPRTGKISSEHQPLSTKDGTKGRVGHIELHEELPQHSSSYEQMMLIMSERTTTTTMSTIAASLAKNAVDLTTSSLKNGGGKVSTSVSSTPGRASSNNPVAAAAVAAAAAVGSNNNENNQFSRLKFVEQWRVNKEKRKQQAMSTNIQPNAYNTRISMAAPLTAQQIKQQQLLQQHQNLDQQRIGNKRLVEEEKGKGKKQRKPGKKNTPAGAAESVKKKRVAKKK